MGNSKRQLFPTSHAWLIALSRFYCNTLYCLQPLCYVSCNNLAALLLYTHS